MTELATPTAALLELRRRDEENGVDPRSPSPVITLGPPAPPPPTIRELLAADPPDWEAERLERERLERERQRLERTRIVEEELRRIPAEDEQTRPAKPRRWRAEQMRGAQP